MVTGAGSGIGRAVARGLLDAGFAVAFAGRRAGALDDAAAGHPEALAVPTDVTDEASVTALFAAVGSGGAGSTCCSTTPARSGRRDRSTRSTSRSGGRAVDMNLVGSFLCARAAFAAMRTQRPQGGRIVNNGSISAHVPRPGSSAYTATKHAITGLTRTLSLDGRPFDIVCGQIDIGNAATDMTARIAAGARQADGTVRPEPTFDVQHVADAVVVRWHGCRSGSTSSS